MHTNTALHALLALGSYTTGVLASPCRGHELVHLEAAVLKAQACVATVLNEHNRIRHNDSEVPQGSKKLRNFVSDTSAISARTTTDMWTASSTACRNSGVRLPGTAQALVLVTAFTASMKMLGLSFATQMKSSSAQISCVDGAWKLGCSFTR